MGEGRKVSCIISETVKSSFLFLNSFQLKLNKKNQRRKHGSLISDKHSNMWHYASLQTYHQLMRTCTFIRSLNHIIQRWLIAQNASRNNKGLISSCCAHFHVYLIFNILYIFNKYPKLSNYFLQQMWDNSPPCHGRITFSCRQQKMAYDSSYAM
jgi:hypothetical protein